MDHNHADLIAGSDKLVSDQLVNECNSEKSFKENYCCEPQSPFRLLVTAIVDAKRDKHPD